MRRAARSRCPPRLAVLAGALLAASPAQAAWTEPEGEGLVITAVTVTFSRADFDENGELFVAPVKRRIEVSSYIQYGLFDGWTVIVQPTYAQARTGTPEVTRAEGLSKFFFAVRHRLYQEGDEVLSIQPGITFSPGDRERALLLGGGDAIGELRGLWGYNFAVPDPLGEAEDSLPAFMVIELAPRVPEGSEPPIELEADATLGIRVRDDTMMLVQSLNKLPVDSRMGSYAKYQLQSSSVTDIGWGLSLQVGGTYTFAGRNVDQEIATTIGLWLRF